MNTDSWRILRYALSRLTVFVLVLSGILGIAIGVQHDWQSGLRVAVSVFLFLFVICVWINRELIRITFFDHSADD
jgi:uncharacterized membrane protein YwaF